MDIVFSSFLGFYYKPRSHFWDIFEGLGKNILNGSLSYQKHILKISLHKSIIFDRDDGVIKVLRNPVVFHSHCVLAILFGQISSNWCVITQSCSSRLTKK